MIYESSPWKQELKRRVKQIGKYNTVIRFDNKFDATYIIMEKNLMFSAFATRKLIECEKLSDSADSYSFPIKAYRPLKPVDRMHRWPDEDTHDWNHPVRLTALGKNICNWLIHSYIFCLLFEENGPVTGLYVSSDYDRNKYLYEIELKSWLDYLNYVAADNVVAMESHYDDNKHDYIVIRKERRDYL